MTEISAGTRHDVYIRDNWQCQGCGICLKSGWKSVQHRKARGVGGSNHYPNLVLLCGSAVTGCHARCEARDPGMRDRGLWVPSWEDENAVPVTRWDGTRVWLLPGALVSYAPPAGLAPAAHGADLPAAAGGQAGPPGIPDVSPPAPASGLLETAFTRAQESHPWSVPLLG